MFSKCLACWIVIDGDKTSTAEAAGGNWQVNELSNSWVYASLVLSCSYREEAGYWMIEKRKIFPDILGANWTQYSTLVEAMLHIRSFGGQFYFHAFTFLEDCLQEKLFYTLKTYSSSFCVAFAFQLVMKRWKVRRQAARLYSLQSLLRAIVFQSNCMVRFDVTGSTTKDIQHSHRQRAKL